MLTAKWKYLTYVRSSQLADISLSVFGSLPSLCTSVPVCVPVCGQVCCLVLCWRSSSLAAGSCHRCLPFCQLLLSLLFLAVTVDRIRHSKRVRIIASSARRPRPASPPFVACQQRQLSFKPGRHSTSVATGQQLFGLMSASLISSRWPTVDNVGFSAKSLRNWELNSSPPVNRTDFAV